MIRRRAHHVIDAAILTAVGVDVATGAANARVSVRRHHDGTWRVLEMWSASGWDSRIRDEAVSITISVVTGANLVGVWTCDFSVSSDVRWVRVRRRRWACHGVR